MVPLPDSHESPEAAAWRVRGPAKFPPAWASAWGDDRYGVWADLHVPGPDTKVPVVQRLRWIEPGEFWMGSPEGVGEANEHPQHLVTIA